MTRGAVRARAGAIIALADETVPGGRQVGDAPTGEVRREPFPLGLHMSARATRNPNVVPAFPAMTAAEDRQGP